MQEREEKWKMRQVGGGKGKKILVSSSCHNFLMIAKEPNCFSWLRAQKQRRREKGNDKRRIPVMCLHHAAAAAAKSLQSCPTLCDPRDGSPPVSAIPGILQARTPEGVAISFSSAWKWKVKVKSLSRVWLFATPWTAAYQVPPSMGFSKQEYWSGVPLPAPWGRY